MKTDWNAFLRECVEENKYQTDKKPRPIRVWMPEPEYDSNLPMEPFIADGPALPRYVKPKESATPYFHLPAPTFRNVICAAALVVAFGLLLALAGAWWFG